MNRMFKVRVNLITPDGHVLTDVYQCSSRPVWTENGSILALSDTGLGRVEIPRRVILRVTTEVGL